MTKKLFATLEVYRDDAFRSAALNMALDEALLESAQVSSIRFYRWASPALSFGYFGRYANVADCAAERDLVRRWTGGGIVFHGNDLTYAIVIPANDQVFAESSLSIYERVHQALRDALIAAGQLPAAVCDRRANNATVIDRRYSECFTNPVPGDVMLDGRKIAGAAQRRTRRGLLQQGSIQHVDVGNGLAQRFAAALAGKCEARAIAHSEVQRAHEIAAQKYATEAWLRKR